MKHKIFFVGMYHKPGLKPLDSSTKSGRLIDRICERIPADLYTCHKTNLSPCDEAPDMERFINEQHAERWHEQNRPGPNDIVVLLGRWVSARFKTDSKQGFKSRVIHINHPSSVIGKWEPYIQESIIKILNK